MGFGAKAAAAMSDSWDSDVFLDAIPVCGGAARDTDDAVDSAEDDGAGLATGGGACCGWEDAADEDGGGTKAEVEDCTNCGGG